MNSLDGLSVVIDSRVPAAVIFLDIGVIVVHLGVVGQRPQSGSIFLLNKMIQLISFRKRIERGGLNSNSVRRSAQSALRVQVLAAKVTANKTRPAKGRQSANSFHPPVEGWRRMEHKEEERRPNEAYDPAGRPDRIHRVERKTIRKPTATIRQ